VRCDAIWRYSSCPCLTSSLFRSTARTERDVAKSEPAEGQELILPASWGALWGPPKAEYDEGVLPVVTLRP
jgi:hypothetical protein